MATEDTVDLSAAHAPQQASLEAFTSILDTVKSELIKLRRDHDSNTTLPYQLPPIPLTTPLQSTNPNTSTPSPISPTATSHPSAPTTSNLFV